MNSSNAANKNPKSSTTKYKKMKTEKWPKDSKKEVPAYKYSKKGTGTLYEAIILDGQPYFVTWYPDYGTNNENIKIIPFIEESTRIIKPPNQEEYPYTPYEFTDKQELNEYFLRANMITIDELYKIAKAFFQKYVDRIKT